MGIRVQLDFRKKNFLNFYQHIFCNDHMERILISLFLLQSYVIHRDYINIDILFYYHLCLIHLNKNLSIELQNLLLLFWNDVSKIKIECPISIINKNIVKIKKIKTNF
jgi:hypothetical protein